MTEPIDKETETKTERETPTNTKKLSFSNTNPVVLKCPVCSKPFERETKQKAFNAIKGHYLGTKDGRHEGSFPYTMADLGLVEIDETEEEPISEPRETISPQRRKAKRKTRKAEPTWETEGEVPDPLTLLRNQLCLYGLNSRSAVAVTDYMKSYHVDDIIVLNKALMDVGMSTSKRRMFLESWINARNINISFEVQEELRLFQRDEYVSAYDKMGMRIRPREREEEKESNRQFNLGHQIGEMKQMVKQLSEGEGGEPIQAYEDPRIETLTSEIKEMRTKLDDEREKRRDDQMKTLTDEIKELKEVTKTGRTQVDAVVEGIHGVERVIVALAGGNPIERKPPKREKVAGKSTLVELMPQEYVD